MKTHKNNNLVAVALVLLLMVSAITKPPALAAPRNPNGVAVIIGNTDYRNEQVPDVAYAKRDAVAFKQYVIDVLGFDAENIIELHNASQAEIYGAFGNHNNPRGKLWSFLDPEGRSDVVVFYSGHGVPGHRKRRGYLLPVDAAPDTAEINGYPIDLLYQNLTQLTEAKSVHVFLDACFSGGSHRGMLIRSASPVFVKAELPKVSAKLTVLTAASGEQLASWDEEAQHGLFTHHLLNALYGKADRDKDGKVTAKETRKYLDRHMTRAARRTYRRIQKASLNGDVEAVLAARIGKIYPKRPSLRSIGGDDVASLPPKAKEMNALPIRSARSGPAEAEKALGLTRGDRMLIQMRLNALNHNVGIADGLFGRRTRSAIRSYQTRQGETVTGYLSADQAKILMAKEKESKTTVGVEKSKQNNKKDIKDRTLWIDINNSEHRKLFSNRTLTFQVKRSGSIVKQYFKPDGTFEGVCCAYNWNSLYDGTWQVRGNKFCRTRTSGGWPICISFITDGINAKRKNKGKETENWIWEEGNKMP